LQQVDGPATKKRIILAIYLDFLVYWVVWGLALHAIAPGRSYTLPQYIVFGILEFVLLGVVKGSLGEFILGIHFPRTPMDPIQPEGQGPRGVRYVRNAIRSRESLLTMAVGALLMNSGSKTMVRWTMWVPPQPFFGFRPSEEAWPAYAILSGAAVMLAGALVLRMHPTAPWVVILVCMLGVVSVLLSWNLWDQVAAEEVIRRREYQGFPVRSGEVEFMQRIIEVGLLIALLAPAILMFSVRKRYANPGSGTMQEEV
jgi:hypothetical protein